MPFSLYRSRSKEKRKERLSDIHKKKLKFIDKVEKCLAEADIGNAELLITEAMLCVEEGRMEMIAAFEEFLSEYTRRN